MSSCLLNQPSPVLIDLALREFHVVTDVATEQVQVAGLTVEAVIAVDIPDAEAAPPHRCLQDRAHALQVGLQLNDPIPLMVFQHAVLTGLRRLPFLDHRPALCERILRNEPVRRHPDPVELYLVGPMPGVIGIGVEPPPLNRVTQHFLPGVPLFQQHHVERAIRVELRIALELQGLDDVGQVEPFVATLAGLAELQVRVCLELRDLHAGCVVIVACRARLLFTAIMAAARACSFVHWCAVPFRWAARPPFRASSRRCAGSSPAKPRVPAVSINPSCC